MAIAACSAESGPQQDAPQGAQTAIPVEPDGGIGDGAGPPASADTRVAIKAMPPAMIGAWHINELDRAPTVSDCDSSLRGTLDYDRLITIDEGGYGYFETGGRVETVHRRTDSMIDATFDTTYADTPTSERRDFALQDDGSLAVNMDDGDGVMNITEYVRCPGGNR